MVDLFSINRMLVLNLLMQSLGNAVFRNRSYVLINFLLCVILPVHGLHVYKVSVLH